MVVTKMDDETIFIKKGDEKTKISTNSILPGCQIKKYY